MAQVSITPLVMVSTVAQGSLAGIQQQRETGAWIWAIILIIFFALMVLLWLWLDKTFEKSSKPMAHAVKASTPPQPSVPPTPDDLKLIEGIGPKISSLLQESGITTFVDLAHADIDRLNSILKQANLRIAKPDTWAQQARLAADGAWDELKKLQDELKGGIQTG